jgi:hypothetical protein
MADVAPTNNELPEQQVPTQETDAAAPKRKGFGSIGKAALVQARVTAALDNKTAEPAAEPTTEQAPQADAASTLQKPKGFSALGRAVLAQTRVAAALGGKKETADTTTETP